MLLRRCWRQNRPVGRLQGQISVIGPAAVCEGTWTRRGGSGGEPGQLSVSQRRQHLHGGKPGGFCLCCTCSPGVQTNLEAFFSFLFNEDSNPGRRDRCSSHSRRRSSCSQHKPTQSCGKEWRMWRLLQVAASSLKERTWANGSCLLDPLTSSVTSSR